MENPLVSIIVITYNSSIYVLETLKSVYDQTYKNIELIVTDDCSTDNTVEICENWLKKNEDRFVRTKIIKVEKNTGIAPNCNRGFNAATGQWLKFIAGDDVLLSHCINTYIQFINKQVDCKIVVGLNSLLNTGKQDVLNYIPLNKYDDTFFSASQPEQLKKILKGKVSINAQGFFINNQILKSIGGFDERFPYMEDAPLYLKLSINKLKFHGLNIVVALYRIHGSNVSGFKGKNFINLRFYKSVELFDIYVLFPLFCKKMMIFPLLDKINKHIVYKLIILLGNRNNITSKLISFLYFSNLVSSIKRRFQ